MEIVLLAPMLLLGQQEVTFSQYMFNHQSLNPAYAGSKDYTHFTLLHRTQWLNFTGAPDSQAFTFNHKMTPKNFGFGLSGVNDKIGPMSSSRVALDLAYHLPLNNAFLAVGIKAGLTNFDFNETIIQTTVPDDNAFNFDDEGNFTPNIGFGLYYHRPKWYAGMSVPWFIENEILNLQRHYYGIFGGLLNLFDDFEAKPSLLIKYTSGAALDTISACFYCTRNCSGLVLKLDPHSSGVCPVPTLEGGLASWPGFTSARIYQSAIPTIPPHWEN